MSLRSLLSRLRTFPMSPQPTQGLRLSTGFATRQPRFPGCLRVEARLMVRRKWMLTSTKTPRYLPIKTQSTTRLSLISATISVFSVTPTMKPMYHLRKSPRMDIKTSYLHLPALNCDAQAPWMLRKTISLPGWSRGNNGSILFLLLVGPPGRNSSRSTCSKNAGSNSATG